MFQTRIFLRVAISFAPLLLFGVPVVCAWTLSPVSVSNNAFAMQGSIRTRCTVLKGTSNVGSDDWDGDVNYDKDFPASDGKGDPTTDWKAPLSSVDTTEVKLGINVGRMLEPLSAQEAAELKAAATEIINDKVAEGLDDIANMRKRFKREVEQTQRQVQLTSELNAQRESERLLSKIDQLTADFLSSTDSTRLSTKMAAAADKAMEGQGVEIGVWGSLGGASVGTMRNPSSTLLGSVEAGKKASKEAVAIKSDESVESAPPSIVVLADVQSDDYAKALVPRLQQSLPRVLPGLQVRVFKPTDTVPIGGDNADCILLFCTSFSSVATVNTALDRLLRKTLTTGGALANPPTQLVAITSLGTERTNKMPYSMQNLMGGKLDKRRQVEEAVIRVVRDRVVDPPLDYSICKLGDLNDKTKDDFQLLPGDSLDGSVDVETAVKVLEQAIAFQPAARNTTLSLVGKLQQDKDDEETQRILDEAFLKLDGPELWRQSVEIGDYDQFVTYLFEWASLLAQTPKGLTTPVRAERSRPRAPPVGVKKQAGVQLLFLPTATGKNYVSAKDEAAMGDERTGAAPRRTSAVQSPMRKEGGVELVAEVLADDSIRVRAKRCNYADDAVIKELSEATILSRVKDSIQVWTKDHA